MTRWLVLLIAVIPSVAGAQTIRVEVSSAEAIQPARYPRSGPVGEPDCYGKKIFSRPCTPADFGERELRSRPPRLSIELVELRAGNRRTLARSSPGARAYTRTFRRLRTPTLDLRGLDAIEIDIRDGTRLIDQHVLTPHELAHGCHAHDVTLGAPHLVTIRTRIECGGAR